MRNRDRNFIARDSAAYKYFARPGRESGRPRPAQIGRDSLNELQGGEGAGSKRGRNSFRSAAPLPIVIVRREREKFQFPTFNFPSTLFFAADIFLVWLSPFNSCVDSRYRNRNDIFFNCA